MFRQPPPNPALRTAQLIAERAEWLAFLRRRVGSDAEAEDLLHSVFLQALRHADEVRTDENLSAWFYRPLRYALADHHQEDVAEHRRIGHVNSNASAANVLMRIASRRVVKDCPLRFSRHGRCYGQQKMGSTASTSSARPPTQSSASFAVDTAMTLTLGGVKQFVRIRGIDRRLPFLLFLHGGPGLPATPFAGWDAGLEEKFVMVHWDQRGAGKSFSLFGASQEFNVEQFVADARDLTQWLVRQFQCGPVVLVGHSWGSVIGAITAARYPELFSAYVGIGQVANLPESEKIAYANCYKTALELKLSGALVGLKLLGPPPYATIEESEALERLAQSVASTGYSPACTGSFILRALRSGTYSLIDLIKIPLGVRRATENLWNEIFHRVDLFTQVPRIEVPVFFILGRHDVVVSEFVAKRYFDSLSAPQGKTFIRLERSGHWPQFESPNELCEILHTRVLGAREPMQMAA